MVTAKIRITKKDLQRKSKYMTPSNILEFIPSWEQRKCRKRTKAHFATSLVRGRMLEKRTKSRLFHENNSVFTLKNMSAIINKMGKELEEEKDWTNHTWLSTDEETFPEIFVEFAGQSFKEVYENEKDYVEFILSVREATGLFKAFQIYCQNREQT